MALRGLSDAIDGLFESWQRLIQPKEVKSWLTDKLPDSDRLQEAKRWNACGIGFFRTFLSQLVVRLGGTNRVVLSRLELQVLEFAWRGIRLSVALYLQEY